MSFFADRCGLGLTGTALYGKIIENSLGGEAVLNGKIIAVLGAALIVCTYITDMVWADSTYSSRINERIKYAELDADPHGTYAGYNVEELGEGYDKPEAFMGKVMIDFPVISQFPELPTGCEITCADALLQYLGFDIDKVVLSDSYMRQSDNFYVDDNGTSYGPDPYQTFAGDPKKSGYGCYAPVIAKALNSYFSVQKQSDNYKAVILKDLNSADIEKLLSEGVPLIVWASQDMEPYRYNRQSDWTGIGTGRNISWLGNSHTLVLVGYDPNAYYFMDAGEDAAIVPYSKEAFIRRWNENGCQTVAVKKLKSE